jgi:hypothetical protein
MVSHELALITSPSNPTEMQASESSTEKEAYQVRTYPSGGNKKPHIFLPIFDSDWI